MNKRILKSKNHNFIKRYNLKDNKKIVIKKPLDEKKYIRQKIDEEEKKIEKKMNIKELIDKLENIDLSSDDDNE